MRTNLKRKILEINYSPSKGEDTNNKLAKAFDLLFEEVVRIRQLQIGNKLANINNFKNDERNH